MIAAKRFVVSIRSAKAPQSKGGKFRRPVHVRVLDSSVSEWHAVRRLLPGLKFERSNVDSRYNGLKAAYGQAIRVAEELAAQLNRQYSDQVSLSCVI